MTKTRAKLETETSKIKNNNNYKGYNKNNNRYGGSSRNDSLFKNLSQNFEGEESSIGVVLGLRFKKNEKKVLSKIFRANMSNYISGTMKYGNIVLGIVETCKDVRDTYNKKYMLKYLNIEDKKS